MKLFFWGMMVQVLGALAAILTMEVTGNRVASIPFLLVMVVGVVMVITDMRLEAKRRKQWLQKYSHPRRPYCEILEGYIRDN